MLQCVEQRNKLLLLFYYYVKLLMELLMAISVRLDSEFVNDVQVYAEAYKRSVPKQIEHWAEIGRMAEDNPDLPYEFIKDAVVAMAEVKAGKLTPYVREKRD